MTPALRSAGRQREAADPRVSAFVSASAGSGKTKLLIDRLLRLMLDGADPTRIQCLTYTTAAAAEMALRLRSVLGTWVTLDDSRLDAELAALGLAADAAVRAAARALFARVVDLPGGMRIATIHAFCQSLLRRFPLEAALSPQFRLLADADAAATLAGSQEAVLAGADPAASGRRVGMALREAALAQVAVVDSQQSFAGRAHEFVEARDRLGPLLRADPARLAEALRAVLGAPADAAVLLRAGVTPPDEARLRTALCVVESGGTATSKANAARQLAWLGGDAAARTVGWDGYLATFCKSVGEPTSQRTVVGEKLAREQPWIAEAVLAEQARVLDVAEKCRAADLAGLSAALLALLLPVADGYAATKEARARLDYGDLIDVTTTLLRDPGTAWVLHKLDDGLDHLLLDEVQDTAPAQWKIAHALVDDFFAGIGARPGGVRTRTVFAVGDRKQSIFSFQGAEPDEFEFWRIRLRERAEAAGSAFLDSALDVSFRSVAPVLALVDAVFADPRAAAGVVGRGETLTHLCAREGQAGGVELWPLEPRPEPEQPPAWHPPERRTGRESAPQRLVERVADWIAAAVGGALELPSRGRAARPGDILVLVRTRALSGPLVRALKQRGVPVAGLDRMVLTEQAAVADLLSLCDTLLLPQDDLSLATVLTSPLGGLDDDDLIALAPGRTAPLWDTLRRRAAERPTWQAAWEFLAALFARVDYASPHALLAEALGPLGGRARLLARLGHEAAEPIDELLAAALQHAQEHPPALQGFVQWLRVAAASIKREASAAGDAVRVMTVHGAKGLQAPVVILPDTTTPQKEAGGLLWAEADGLQVPVWVPNASWRCAGSERLREAARQRRAEEHNRLLYVALTRAEDRLVVAGFQPKDKLKDESWYRIVERAVAAMPEAARTCPQTARPDRADRGTAAMVSVGLPAWAGAAPDWRALPPPQTAAAPVRLAPSRPRDAEHGEVPPAASPLDAVGSRFARGGLLHTLLQHLPDLPRDGRDDAARRFLERPASGLAPAEAATALVDVRAVLDAPALADAWGAGSRSEVPLVGVVAGQVVAGLVDRLRVTERDVLVVDYKTSRRPPTRVEDTPVMYLRQLAAYRAVLRDLYPERPVRCVLVWTEGARVQEIPPGLLDRHAPGAA